MSLSPIAAAIAMCLAFAAAQGLSYPLLTIVQQEMGISPFFIGISAAMTPLGILCGSLLTPHLIARVPLWRVGWAASVLLALIYILIWLSNDPILWLPLRFVLGILINLVFITCDLTVLSIAPPHQKGRYVAMMAGVMQVGFAIGPALLLVTGTRGATPFVTAALGFVVCALVVWLARGGMPSPGQGERPEKMWRAFLIAPTVLAAIAATAAFEQGALTLLPVYAAEHGRDSDNAALLLTIMITGSIVMTPLAAFAAERFGARRAMVGAAGVAALGAPFMTLLIETNAIYVYMALWGGLYYAVYCLAFTEIGERFGGAQLVAMNAATGVAWGSGGLIGVPLAGAAMERLSAEALPMMFCLIYAALALAAWLRGRGRGTS